MELTRTFTLSAAAPAAARESLRELSPAIPPGQLADLEIIASELVTNSVRHSGLNGEDCVEMRVRRFPDRLRIEVVDRGRGFARDPKAQPRRGGHGLQVVGLLADQWGTDSGSETRVWAELWLRGR